MKAEEQYTDKDLFTSIAQGNEPAFKMLFDRYKEKVYASAYKWTKSADTSEEITQEVFVKLWMGREKLAKVEDPASYIYRAISNKVRDHLKSNLNAEKILAIIRRRQLAYANLTQEMLDLKGSEQLIWQAVGRLSEQKRRIFILNRQEGRSAQQIADQLNLSVHTVKSHLYEALQFIREYLKNAAIFLVFVLSQLFR